jgi:hypothetical protein
MLAFFTTTTTVHVRGTRENLTRAAIVAPIAKLHGCCPFGLQTAQSGQIMKLLLYLKFYHKR